MEGDQVYADKQLVVFRTGAPAELSLSGAIDFYNADAVAAALIAELQQSGDVSTALSDAITGNGDLHLTRPAVEQNHRPASVLQLLHPDFLIAIFGHAAPLHSQHVLVHRDHFLVQTLDDRPRRGRRRSKVDPERHHHTGVTRFLR